MPTNTKKLSGKVAVVTGASKSIGASIAKHLAAEGAAVIGQVNDMLDQLIAWGGALKTLRK